MMRKPSPIKAMLTAALAFALLASCATPAPRKLTGEEPYAVLYTTPVDCVARGACVSRVSIRAINGDATQRMTTQYNYQVAPGDVSVIVLAHTVLGDKIGYRQGVCELKWVAEAGKIYELDRIIAPGGFNVTAVNEDAIVAACFAEFA